jgi:excinuclease ABC subunit A
MSHILIKGAKENNLKNIDVIVPKNKLTVITGVSGSGKSSLAFDIIYKEGQRRYLMALSIPKQFLPKLDKPRVEDIDGISPTLALGHKAFSRKEQKGVIMIGSGFISRSQWLVG